MSTLQEELEELSSAEEFLEYFAVAYDPQVVRVNRLHILQRFHDYLRRGGPLPVEEAAARAHYGQWLARAYGDFVDSDARSQKVFKVFRRMEPQVACVPLSQLRRSPA